MTQFFKDCTLTGYISYYTYANLEELHKHSCIMNKNARVVKYEYKYIDIISGNTI